MAAAVEMSPNRFEYLLMKNPIRAAVQRFVELLGVFARVVAEKLVTG